MKAPDLGIYTLIVLAALVTLRSGGVPELHGVVISSKIYILDDTDVQ